MKARKKEDGKKKFTVFQMIFRKKFQRLKTTSCAALQMHHRACADEVFDDGFFLEKHRDNNGMFCERSQRDPGGDVTGDNLIFCAEGDLVIVLSERLVAGFTGLVDGEGECFAIVMDFQQRSLAYPGALVVDRVGEFLADIAVRFAQDIGGVMSVQAAVAVKIHAAGSSQFLTGEYQVFPQFYALFIDFVERFRVVEDLDEVTAGIVSDRHLETAALCERPSEGIRMSDTDQCPFFAGSLEEKFRFVFVDIFPRHILGQVQAEDMSVVCGIFHARDECDRLWMLFQIIFNFVMSGDGVVIGQGERVHVICHHKVRQFFAGKYCVGFVGMIV